MTTTKHFVILEEIVKEFKTGKNKYYKCKCDCGNIFESSKRNVDSGITISCGKKQCNKHVLKMIGKKFGRLTIISHFSRKDGYLCKCDCGNITKARTYALKTGRHNSCGCLNKETQAKRLYKGKGVATLNRLYRSYKNSAKKRKYEFKLDMESFFNLIKSPCVYCGDLHFMEYSFEYRYHIIKEDPLKYNGIDRVDNTRGYELDNCVSCCHTCNNSKSTLSVEEWKKWISRLYNNMIKSN